ncbi:MAG: DsbC family protein [Burkholderiales bacterium]|nr:DsbC family protein [Burkholderiales bacterium]MCE7876970.1 DsbC family protein [Betaproteobacteria bacterium PRO3]
MSLTLVLARLARPSLPLLLAALTTGIASAQSPAPATAPQASTAASPDVAALRKVLAERFPGAEIGAITRTNYLGGLYEVQFDDRLVYTDAKANHVLVGALWDSVAKTNLTEDRLRKLNRVAWSSLPLELAIKKVKGNGERKLVVFSDADCPFCHKLEEEMKGLDNVTVYTFLFPIDQLHPQAAQKSRQIWCSDNPTKAWDAYYATGKVPDNKGDCPNPVAATQALGQKLRIQATPTMILADGSVLPGALPLTRLEAEMKTAEAEAKKLAKK